MLTLKSLVSSLVVVSLSMSVANGAAGKSTVRGDHLHLLSDICVSKHISVCKDINHTARE